MIGSVHRSKTPAPPKARFCGIAAPFKRVICPFSAMMTLPLLSAATIDRGKFVRSGEPRQFNNLSRDAHTELRNGGADFTFVDKSVLLASIRLRISPYDAIVVLASKGGLVSSQFSISLFNSFPITSAHLSLSFATADFKAFADLSRKHLAATAAKSFDLRFDAFASFWPLPVCFSLCSPLLNAISTSSFDNGKRHLQTHP
mmetsp:Transcript_20276/g.42499  ORF Transcript_20276/g.42499 Transcript_20276/m.42499 type:complete len:201 (+) Transcript_20276:296-898(+)